MLLTNPQKQKFDEIYLEKFSEFSNTASDTVEAFSLNSSIQIWHQILLFLLKYPLGLALIPTRGGHSSLTPRLPSLHCYSSLHSNVHSKSAFHCLIHLPQPLSSSMSFPMESLQRLAPNCCFQLKIPGLLVQGPTQYGPNPSG